jgi:hypothetical protein
MVNNSTSINKTMFVLLILVELLTITVKEVSVRFVDTGGIVDHHC